MSPIEAHLTHTERAWRDLELTVQAHPTVRRRLGRDTLDHLKSRKARPRRNR